MQSITSRVYRLYAAERAAGQPARVALAVARTRIKWAGVEGTLVRLRAEPDDSADLSFLEQDCYQGTREGRAHAKQVIESADRDGCWGLVGEYRLGPDDEWEHGGSVWGLIGDDFAHVEADIMAETLEALKAAAKGRCSAGGGTGRKGVAR